MARTTWPVALVLSLGVATLMFQSAGFGAIPGAGEPSAGLEPVGESVQERANESAARNEPDAYGGQASGSDDPLINFILHGGGSLLSVLKLVGALPNALINLGFPTWFAYPLGGIVQIVAGIGVIQFVTGRKLT